MPIFCRAYRRETDTWVELEVPNWILQERSIPPYQPTVPPGGVSWVRSILGETFVPLEFRWEDENPLLGTGNMLL